MPVQQDSARFEMKHPPANKYNRLYPTVKDTDGMVVYGIRHNWTGLWWGLTQTWSKYPKLYTRLDRVEQALVRNQMELDKVSVVSWILHDPLVINTEGLDVRETGSGGLELGRREEFD